MLKWVILIFNMSGKIDNYLNYYLATEDSQDANLKGDFNFSSDYLDLDELMGTGTEETATTSTEETTSIEEEAFLVPDNIDFVLRSDIKKLKYNDVNITSITGDIIIKDEIAKLDNISI